MITMLIYGWIAGITAVVLCLLYGFDTLMKMMTILANILYYVPFIGSNYAAKVTSGQEVIIAQKQQVLGSMVSDRRSLREQGLEGITGNITTSSQMKLTVLCCLTWCDSSSFNEVGTLEECRLELTGRKVNVYSLLPLRTRGSNSIPSAGGIGISEHVKGQMQLSRIIADVVKPGKREKKLTAQGVSGRVLVLRSIDGLSLFTNPDTNHTATGVSRTTAVSSSWDGESFTMSRFDNSTLTFDSDRGQSLRDDGTASEAGKVTWSTMVIKFSEQRDLDKWMTLLRGVAEAEAWRDFAKALPNPDTFNTFVSRFLFQNMRGEGGLASLIKGAIRKKLEKVPTTKFPRDLEGQILLDEFEIGSQIPWISDVSEPTMSTSGEVGFDFNLQYKGGDDGFVLHFRLALRYRGIRIPHVVISLKLRELEATVHTSIGPPPSKKFWIAGHKPPVLRIEVHQGCARRAGVLHRILTALPDLSEVMANLLKLYLFSDMILPYLDDFPLPSVEKTPTTTPVAEKVRTFDRKRAAALSSAPVGSAARRDPPAAPKEPSMSFFQEGLVTTPAGAASPTAPKSGGDSVAADQSGSSFLRQRQSATFNSSSVGSQETSSRRPGGFNLRSFLKDKGKDMSRAAVARTKKQRSSSDK